MCAQESGEDLDGCGARVLVRWQTFAGLKGFLLISLRTQQYNTQADGGKQYEHDRNDRPAGTWALDPVHSLVGFEVSYMAGTFRGDVPRRLRFAERGRRQRSSRGRRQRRQRRREGREPRHTPAEPRLLRFRELSSSCGSQRGDFALESDHVTANGEITIKGVTKPVTVTGTGSAPMEDPWGQPALRPHPECRGRSHRLRPQVEQPAAERRPAARRTRLGSSPSSSS